MVNNDQMVYRTIPWQLAVPKIMILSFPKAGTHMAEQMVQPIASPVRNPIVNQAWCGNIGGNGFWNIENPRIGEHAQYERLSMCMPGQYYKSHSVYRKVFGNFINMCGYGVIFMYRDLRDVAVSWAHHVTNATGSTNHPAKKFFLMIKADGGFDAVLEAIIDGVGPLPGVIEHWEEFAPWLDQDWVHPVKFEDMRENPEEVAEGIVQYLIGRTREIREETLEISAVSKMKFKEMADETRKRKQSPTFRKGKPGGWKEEFSSCAAQKFVEHGGHDWLVKLGYEEEEDGA